MTSRAKRRKEAREASKPSQVDEAALADFDALMLGHAPPQWKEKYGQARGLASPSLVPLVVLAVGIRSITIIQREAIRFPRYATTVSYFLGWARDTIFGADGWFDRFTGQGFLAYWIPRPGETLRERSQEAFGELARAFQTAAVLVKTFDSEVLPLLQRNSANFPPSPGLALGLDVGTGYLVSIAGALSVVGLPVVGAVRMMQASETPGELVAGISLRGFIENAAGDILPGVITERTARNTKEYPNGEICYSARFKEP
jgi:hypothetical protein